MILYTNGCSFTATGGLDHLFKNDDNVDQKKRLSIAWPSHLGKLLNAHKVYNLASGCGSNQRIVRTTYEWLRNLPADEIKEVVAVIQITEWSRFEMTRPSIIEKDMWENSHGDWVHVKAGCVAVDIYDLGKFRLTEGFDELHNLSQEKLVSTSDKENFYRTICYLYALKGLFESYGIKDFYIWQQSHEWNRWPKEHLDMLYRNFNVLDKHYEWGDWDSWEYETIGNGDSHPSVEGNKQLAKLIYDSMLKLGYNR